MKTTYFPPTFKGKQFTCPHCGVLATQAWRDIVTGGSTGEFDKIWVSHCENVNCRRECLWIEGVMTIPDMEGIPYPNDDLSDEIKEDYMEARSMA